MCTFLVHHTWAVHFHYQLPVVGCIQQDGRYKPKLQALVYDILPSTAAVFSYAIGSTKMSANEQFFVGAQTVVSLFQTTQIKHGLSFIAANKVF